MNQIMSSYTFTLNGHSSELEATLYPPIELNDEFVCGLVDFQSFMSIPNINYSNNKLYFIEKCEVNLEAGIFYTMNVFRDEFQTKTKYARPETIDEFERAFYQSLSTDDNIQKMDSDVNLTGAVLALMNLGDRKLMTYFDGLENIQQRAKFMLERIPESVKTNLKLDTSDRYYYSDVDYKYTHEFVEYIEIPIGSYELESLGKKINYMMENTLDRFKFNVYPNSATLKCEIECSHTLLCTDASNVLAKIFGFANYRIIPPNAKVESDWTVKISQVNVIKVECNIIGGSYSNGKPGHTLHEFYPSVGSGYKIVEVPKNVIYLPLTTRSIRNINVRIVDQDNNLVDFRGENITLRIHIKKL